jgi:hypothetical protein
VLHVTRRLSSTHSGLTQQWLTHDTTLMVLLGIDYPSVNRLTTPTGRQRGSILRREVTNEQTLVPGTAVVEP